MNLISHKVDTINIFMERKIYKSVVLFFIMWYIIIIFIKKKLQYVILERRGNKMNLQEFKDLIKSTNNKSSVFTDFAILQNIKFRS